MNALRPNKCEKCLPSPPLFQTHEALKVKRTVVVLERLRFSRLTITMWHEFRFWGIFQLPTTRIKCSLALINHSHWQAPLLDFLLFFFLGTCNSFNRQRHKYNDFREVFILNGVVNFSSCKCHYECPACSGTSNFI